MNRWVACYYRRLRKLPSFMSEDPRILLIAPDTSYRIGPYLRAAHKLGIEVVLAAHGPYVPVNPCTSQGINIDMADIKAAQHKIVAALAQAPVRAVIATDDSTVELATRVATVFGLAHNPVTAVQYSRRKDLARACLHRAKLPAPSYRKLDLGSALMPQLSLVDYPCVIKPLALSGSRGVIRANDVGELLTACARLQTLLRNESSNAERQHVLVERFIPGREFAVEGLLHRGRLQVLAVFDKPDPLQGPFFEETYYITPSRLPAAAQLLLADETRRACAAYGLREGPVHAELRLDESKAWIIEVAARTIGGQCARLLEFGSGHKLEELVLAQAVGQPLSVEPGKDASGVLMIPIPRAGVLRRVEGVLAASRVEFVTDIEISMREGQQVVPLPEGSSYLGFMFAHAPTPEQAEAALRKAHSLLKIVIAPLIPLERVGEP